MAYNSATYTPGEGASGAIDRISSKDYPLVKPVIGGEGVAAEISSSNPMPITPATRAKISPSITVTAATYVANQNVGGKLSLSSINSASGRSGTIESIVLRSASTTAITAIFRVYLFDSDPSGSTFTDNGTHNCVAADITKCLEFVDITLWADAGTSSHASIGRSGPLAIPFKPSGTQLWAAIQTLGTPVFSGTGVLSMDVMVSQD